MAERLAPEVRRARILDTAMVIITEEGFRGLTMRSLARRCDMSAPGLMHYFADLPTLLMAVLEYRDRTDGERVVSERGGQLTARQLFDGVVGTMLARPEAARLFAVLEGEALAPDHPAHDYFQRRFDAIVEGAHPILAKEFADPDSFARRLFAILDGLQLHWLRDVDGFDLRAQWDAIADPLFASEARVPD
ncbi:TetR/AcrR family transcriptional regulator [Demequina aurantiaca]|uniref:TetR/AcrR family transcriptional regulator n=1 Tax=Demequina aurantiaca TaxID=676200 RepID=UPI000781BA20|nr:TetR/AcrR family transcriptional regulator [Demequina aurantiaca]